MTICRFMSIYIYQLEKEYTDITICRFMGIKNQFEKEYTDMTNISRFMSINIKLKNINHV